MSTLHTLSSVPDLEQRDGPLTSDNDRSHEVHKVLKVSGRHENLNPGDIVRVDRSRGRRFKVKSISDGNVDCWELEAGIAGNQRTFPVGDVRIVQRAKGD